MNKQINKKPRGLRGYYYDFLELITFAPEGYKLFLGFLVASFLLYFVSVGLSLLALVVALFFGKIFHLPRRVATGLPSSVVSPADGKIEFIGSTTLPAWLQDKQANQYLLISIKVGFFNSRINTIPVSGYIEKQVYQTNQTSLFAAKGKGDIYESNVIYIKEQTEAAERIIVEQRAGAFKRSVVSFMYENDLVRQGEVFGILRFGKYVDIYLPASFQSQVVEGQTMLAGETILGFLANQLKVEEKEII